MDMVCGNCGQTVKHGWICVDCVVKEGPPVWCFKKGCQQPVAWYEHLRGRDHGWFSCDDHSVPVNKRYSVKEE